MAIIDDVVRDAELVVAYAATNAVALPISAMSVLTDAGVRSAALTAPGSDRNNYYKAFAQAVASLGVSVNSLRNAQGLSWESDRLSRQRQLATEANELLNYAVANSPASGRQIDDEIRNPILAASAAVGAGTASVGDVQALYKAYQSLSAKMAPITAETLAASRTELPSFNDFKSDFWKAWERVTLGRFCNAILFGLMLALVSVSLGYYSLGTASQSRHSSLIVSVAKLEQSVREKKAFVEANKLPPTTASPEDKAKAQKLLEETNQALAVESAQFEEQKSELYILPERLWNWAHEPCEENAWFVFKWTLCSTLDGEKAPDKSAVGAVRARLAANAVAEKLALVYLPLLVGWLGAHAFILRQMAQQIRTNTFARASAVQDVVQIALGSLAGLAVTTLLGPQLVTPESLKNVPALGLAFVAGYGIELVYVFMDRIISAFATK